MTGGAHVVSYLEIRHLLRGATVTAGTRLMLLLNAGNRNAIMIKLLYLNTNSSLSNLPDLASVGEGA